MSLQHNMLVVQLQQHTSQRVNSLRQLDWSATMPSSVVTKQKCSASLISKQQCLGLGTLNSSSTAGSSSLWIAATCLRQNLWHGRSSLPGGCCQQMHCPASG